jgi:F420-dependent oxidoreductase-like protein
MKISIGIGGSTIDEVVAQTERAASTGFTRGWLSNIFGVDALTAIAVAGRHVPGIHLGTAVVPTYPRHPYAMAQQARSTWDATKGNFTLGIGLSHQIVIESMWGLSYEKPAIHMREYLAVLLPLLREGNVAFDGEHYRVAAPLEQIGPAGGPPVLIAAMAPVMLALAGGVADGTILWMTGARTVGDHVAPTINAAAEKAGKPAPEVVASLPVALTNDVDAARDQAAATFAVYGGLPSYRAMLDKEGAGGPEDVAIIGDEAALEAGIRSMADAGVTEFSAALFGDGEQVRRTSDFLRGLL